MLTEKQKECLKDFTSRRCEICKKRENDLNRLVMHHIKRQYQEINDSLRNLMCICEICHKRIHSTEQF